MFVAVAQAVKHVKFCKFPNTSDGTRRLGILVSATEDNGLQGAVVCHSSTSGLCVRG